MIGGNTALIVIDIQGKLASLMDDHENLISNAERMIKIAQILKAPILWTEQVPEKLGATTERIAQLLFPLLKPIHKRSFSCYPCPEFKAALESTRAGRVLIVGIEAHVCVYQTARDLKRHGYDVGLVEDAVSSRTKHNKDVAVSRMRDLGIEIVSAEMAACELLKSSDHPDFKEVMANIKR